MITGIATRSQLGGWIRSEPSHALFEAGATGNHLVISRVAAVDLVGSQVPAVNKWQAGWAHVEKHKISQVRAGVPCHGRTRGIPGSQVVLTFDGGALAPAGTGG